MISLADISGLVSPIEKYKPCWETAVNLLLQLMVIISIVTWGSVFLSSQKLVCMPQNSTIDAKTKFGLVEANFVNAKCSQEQEVEFVTIMPYLLFLHWLLCYLIHNVFWIMPWVSCRFENFFYALREFQKLNPTNVDEVLVSLKKNEEDRQPIEYDDKKGEVLKALNTKMSENERLHRFYIYKCVLVSLFLGSGFVLVYYACKWEMRSGYISCDLHQEIANFKHFTCIFLPGCFIFYAVVFHGILLCLAILCSLISICKIFCLRVVVPEGWEMIAKGTKGKGDAKFCMWLIQESTNDGDFTKHRLIQRTEN